MPRTQSNHIEIEYETSGDSGDAPLLLVMGLGGQLISWPEELVGQLAEAGFFVIRFDNRDAGLSAKWTGVPDILSVLAGTSDSAPYRIEDMADDAAGLVDSMGLEKVHVVGVSMGGMITQALAIDHADRLLSACSIMSTTGDRSVGMPSEEAMELLVRPVPSSRDEAVRESVAGSRIISSPGFPFDEMRMTKQAEAAYDRSYCPDGTVRQLGAILASPDRTVGLRAVDVPFQVIHGDHDPLVDVSGGVATAAAVPDADLLIIPGMGHDLPAGSWDQITEAVVKNVQRAGA